MKAFLRLMLSVGLAAALSVSVMANDDVNINDETGSQLQTNEEANLEAEAAEGGIVSEENEENNTIALEFKNHYNRVEGSIAEIDLSNVNRILVNSTDINDIYYNLSENTLIYSLNTMEKISPQALKPGQTVSVFYNVMTPQALSLPPQVTPEVIVVHDNELAAFAKVDYFDENSISSDSELKLNLAEEILVVGTDNIMRSFSETKGKNLLVFYTITTRSIPAQTPPVKVVILDSEVLQLNSGNIDTDLAESEELEDQELENQTEETPNEQEDKTDKVEGIINNLESESIIHQDGTRFIALYRVAESLGYGLEWDTETSVVTLTSPESTVSFSIGEETFSHGDLSLAFSNPPFILNSRTYVDEDFLRFIAGE